MYIKAEMTKKENLSKVFGKRVKEVRTHLRYKQKDFAKSLGMAGSYLSEIEKGKARPGFDFFYKITSIYNINPLYLLHGKGEMILDKDDQLPEKGKPVEKDYGDSNRKVHELLWYVERSNLFKYAVLEFFTRYLIKNKEELKEEIGSLFEDEKEK